jgi:hypothetical protein
MKQTPNQRIKAYHILCQKNIETNHEAGKEGVLLIKLEGTAPPSTLQSPIKQVLGLIPTGSEFSRILRFCA